MKDEEYLRSIGFESLPDKNKRLIREVAHKYGENKWWLSDDPAVGARYQLFEDVLMLSFDWFKVGVEKLLGRSVRPFEFAVKEHLQREAKEPIERLEKALAAKKKSGEEAVAVAGAKLSKLKKKGKKIIITEA